MTYKDDPRGSRIPALTSAVAESDTRTRVLVCVATFKRPRMLAILLDSLARQTVLAAPDVALSIAIFDNDPALSGCAVVQQYTALPVHYQPVPEPGLSAVRNATIRLARAEADFMAFMDDDEVAADDWVASLLDAHRQTACNILCGRRIPTFEPGTRSWIIDAGFFHESPLAEHAVLQYGHTANTLLSCALLRRHPVDFDPALAFSGGEDVLFFAQLQAHGEQVRYVPRAVLHDHIQPDRINVRYLLTRAFRAGGTLLIVDSAIRNRALAIPLRLARAFTWFLQACLLVLRAPLSQAAWLRSGLKVSMAAGTVGAILGFQVQPYAYGRKKQ